MARQHILVVDDDPKSLQVLEISLKKAGFLVTTAQNGLDALEKVQTSTPELIISDVKMPRMNGYQFCKRVKDDPNLKAIPFIFLSSQRSLEDKMKGLELGVDDYLTKPIYIKELLMRVHLLLQKKEKESIEQVGAQQKFAGDLADMGVVDLLQTLEIGRKTGVLYLSTPDGRSGLLYFQDGKIIDALQGAVKGERAVYRMLAWADGNFRIDFKPINREAKIENSTQALIMEGMRRLDEWERLAEQLPPLDSVLIIDASELMQQYPEKFPQKAGQMLQLFDGKRTILQAVDESGLDDLPALNIISKLYFQGLLKPLEGQGAGAGPAPAAVAFTSAPVMPQAPAPVPASAAPSAQDEGDVSSTFGSLGSAVAEIFGDSPATKDPGMSSRDLLVQSGSASPAEAPPPAPAAKPASGNGSPGYTLADLAAGRLPSQVSAASRKPASAPAFAPVPSKQASAPEDISSMRAAASKKSPESDVIRGRPRPNLAWILGGAGGLAVASLLVYAVVSGRLGRVFGGPPDLAPYEEALASDSREKLEAALGRMFRESSSTQAGGALISVKVRALLRLGRIEGGAEERLAGASALLSGVPQTELAEPAAQLAWAEYEVARGEFAEARKRLAPLLESASAQVSGRAHYVAGLSALGEEKNTAKAAGHFEAAQRALPQDAGVKAALAEALVRSASYQEARQAAEASLALSSGASLAHKARARACSALADLSCAAEGWRKARDLVPADADAVLGEAVFLWQDKKDAEAAGRALRAIVENAAWKDRGALRARAYFLLGEIAVAAGRVDDARAAYESVRAIDPDYPGLASRLLPPAAPPPVAAAPTAEKTAVRRNALVEGRAALGRGQFRQAIAFLEEAAKENSRDAQLLADLGTAYLQVDESKKAQGVFEKALALNPDDVTALRWLGQIYSSAGRKADAEAMFSRFLKLAPGHPDALLVKALLRRLQ